jgi:type I restriction enzyme S subunit
MWPVGTLCITIAANICDTAILGIPACFPDSIVGFTAGAGVSDVVFVKYALDYAKQRFAGISRGATQDNLSLEKMLSQRLPVPPLAIQQRIASILGSHDELIEVNRRRIAILNEIAQRLFEEWFVHFRFPGHQDVQLRSAGDLRVPRGWGVSRLGDLTAFLSRGIAPRYDENATTLVVGQKCIREQRLSLGVARRQNKSVPQEKLVRQGDVLVNSTGVGTLGRAAQVEEVPAGLTVDSHVTILRPLPELDHDYFGLALLRLEPLFERLGAGATGQTELNRSRVAEVEILVPPADLQTHFGRHARPLRALAFKLGRQNEHLAQSRDLLLPRLISGELSVRSAERKLAEAA